MRWIIGVVLVFLLALAIQSGLLAYAAYVLVGVLLLSRLFTRTGLEVVSATRSVSDDALEVGDRFEVEVRVRNGGNLPLPWVLLEDLLPEFAMRERPPRRAVSPGDPPGAG